MGRIVWRRLRLSEKDSAVPEPLPGYPSTRGRVDEGAVRFRATPHRRLGPEGLRLRAPLPLGQGAIKREIAASVSLSLKLLAGCCELASPLSVTLLVELGASTGMARGSLTDAEAGEGGS